MTKVQKVSVESNNLDFLKTIQKDKYPTVVLFRQHFEIHSAHQSLSELLTLETIIHNFKARKKCSYTQSTWLFRSCILLIQGYVHKDKDQRDLEHLEYCLLQISDQAISHIKRLITLMKEAEQYGFSAEEFKACDSLIRICFKMKDIHIQHLQKLKA